MELGDVFGNTKRVASSRARPPSRLLLSSRRLRRSSLHKRNLFPVVFPHHKTPEFARLTTAGFTVHLRDGFSLSSKSLEAIYFPFHVHKTVLTADMNRCDVRPKNLCVSTATVPPHPPPFCPRGLCEAGEPSLSVSDRCVVKFFPELFLRLNVA